MARVAEQTERFQDMYDFMKPVVQEKGIDISVDERNLLSTAFKNLVAQRRVAWRTIKAIELNDKYNKYSDSIISYRKKLETRLFRDCEAIIELIQLNILQKSPTEEVKAYFLKTCADYYRYIAEISQGMKLLESKEQARKLYDEANSIVLPACNPVKLGIVLNLAVFYYEILQDYKRACAVADRALSDALEKIDDLEEEDFREAKATIELLKENLQIWKEEQEKDNE